MKKINSLFIVLLVAIVMVSCAGHKSNITWKQNEDCLIIEVPDATKYVQLYEDNIVRVTTATGEQRSFPSDTSLVVIDKQIESFDAKEKRDFIVLTSDKLTVKISKETGNIEFLNKDGKSILSEQQTGVRPENSEYVIGQRFTISDTEALYGLGQYQSGNLNHRGKQVLLSQANAISVVPFLTSTANYGILWDNYSKTLFQDDSEGMSFESKVGTVVDYYLVVGDDMDEVIKGYRTLSGKAPMFPKSSLGYWQSRERYHSFDDIFTVARYHREHNLPIDNIVQDWQYWGDNDHWTSMHFVQDRYPKPEENLAKLQDMHIKMMCSIWTAVGKKTQLYKDLDEVGAIFHQVGHWTGGNIYDVFNPTARKIYAKAAMDGLIDVGVTGLWLDGTEVELNNTTSQSHTENMMLKLGSHYMGSFAKYLNAYSLMAVSDLYNDFRARNEIRPFILTRSAFAGQQRYGAVTWSGDIGSSWSIFKDQIAAGVNFSAAGIPYWSHDIGGFFPNANGGKYPDGVKDMAYRELYVRWFQFGVFTPIFRSHGTGTPREIYQFGEKGDAFYDAIAEGLLLRYKLMPYLYSQAWNIYKNDYTLMRPMAMNFTDEKIYDINDAYMFGDEFLVHPVTDKITADNLNQSTYLPNDCGWYDYWTNEYYTGGQYVEKEYPINIFPLFVKEGSIIPMTEGLQYATQKSDKPIKIMVYAGADCEFVYYDDAGDGFDYLDGEYTAIKIKWNQSKKEVTLEREEGSKNTEPINFEFIVIDKDGTVEGGTSYVHNKIDYYELKTGDLLFQVSKPDDFSNAISGATVGYDDIHYTHAGVAYVDETGVYVLEATTPKVTKTPIQEFLDKSLLTENGYVVTVARLKSRYRKFIPAAIERILLLMGKSYDYTYNAENDAYYCSELIQQNFLDRGDKPIFNTVNMSFKNLSSGETDSTWIKHFEKYKAEIPEGEIGSNPGDMSKSKAISIIYHYF